jgi:hypothetical protein
VGGKGLREHGAPHRDHPQSRHQPGGLHQPPSTRTPTPSAPSVRRLPKPPAPAVPSPSHWELGGEGALEFADAVIDACNEENDFKFLYPLEMKLRDRVEIIAKEVYGADGVDWQPEANAKAEMLENDPKYADFATMMVKTHLSLSHDPVHQGCSQELAPAHPRRADLLRRQVPVPLRRHHQPDAWNQLQPGLPPHRCRSGIGEGNGSVLIRSKTLDFHWPGRFARAFFVGHY